MISVVVASLLMVYRPHYKEALGTLLGTGITLVALGLNELTKFYLSTTKLKLREIMEPLDRNTIRFYVEAYNDGSVTVRDAKSVITVLEPKPNVLANYLVKNCLDNKNPCPLATSCGKSRPYLVNKDFPQIDGELLPWSVPEKPIPRPIAIGAMAQTDCVHITSISPRQRARIPVLDAVKVGNGKWIVKIFSEYGPKGPGYDPTLRFPRTCLWLDNTLKLRLKITVYGENLRKPEEMEITVTKEKIVRSIVKNGERR